MTIVIHISGILVFSLLCRNIYVVPNIKLNDVFDTIFIDVFHM